MSKDADQTALAVHHARRGSSMTPGRSSRRSRRLTPTPGEEALREGSTGALRSTRSMSPNADGRKRSEKSVAWQQFLQRQADAAGSKLHRRTQSVERSSLTPGPQHETVAGPEWEGKGSGLTHSRSQKRSGGAVKEKGSSVTPQDKEKERGRAAA